jgi:ectoine hydroxylase-related dioxygenase (phytanoyl-CoA dioxygenase family)
MPAGVDIQAQLEEIDERGYTIIENAFSLDLADELIETLDRLEHERNIVPAANSFEGVNTWRIYNLLALDPAFQQVPVHPVVLPLADAVLGGEVLISSLSSIVIGGGEAAQAIHADDQLLPLPKPHVGTVFNSMWALTDFIEANGATRVIPGSHKADRSPTYGQHYDSIPAEMPKGSILAWHGSLWHGGGENTTEQRRYGIAMNYCAGWIRQQENQQLGLSLDLVATFEPRLRELCGFGSYRGLIGHIDKQTPAQRFFGAEQEPIVWDKIR